MEAIKKELSEEMLNEVNGGKADKEEKLDMNENIHIIYTSPIIVGEGEEKLESGPHRN